jgi:hypothetical protein
MPIVQFKNEDRRTAIVNHFSLDIEEERLFFKYLEEMGYSIDSEDSIIENMIEMWRKNVDY